MASRVPWPRGGAAQPMGDSSDVDRRTQVDHLDLLVGQTLRGRVGAAAVEAGLQRVVRELAQPLAAHPQHQPVAQRACSHHRWIGARARGRVGEWVSE